MASFFGGLTPPAPPPDPTPACPHKECSPNETVEVCLEMLQGKYWAEDWQARWEKARKDGYVLVKKEKADG
jgi:hypothetical protein